MRPLAVIDATLLRRLAALKLTTGQALSDLLPLLYSQIRVPTAVKKEIGKQSGRGRRRLRKLFRQAGGFYESCEARDEFTVSMLAAELDLGESEAIAQADQLREQYSRDVHLLLDERRGLEVARRLKLTVVRTGRLLISLKELGAIDAVLPYLNRLEKLGFHLSSGARHSILAEALES